jgi:hypothetical protein
MVSSDGGRTWSAPKIVIPRFVPNLRPFQIAAGRLIIPGQVMYPYTDDPQGLTGWKRTGLPRIPEWTVDDSEGFHKACAVRGDTIDYCEGSFFQTDDSAIYMMLRTAASIHGTRPAGWLAVTVSRDRGETWSEPQLTDYTDCSSRFHFGRLPDGRYFGLSCPDPKGARTPMILATSKNGVQFDRHYVLGESHKPTPRLEGRNKGGAYGYPSLDIGHDSLYIIYSTGKEDIWASRVRLKDLV